jgi:hypothetical protein
MCPDTQKIGQQEGCNRQPRAKVDPANAARTEESIQRGRSNLFNDAVGRIGLKLALSKRQILYAENLLYSSCFSRKSRAI